MVMKNLKGQKFGKLLVLKRAGSSKHKDIMWKCICDCGKNKIINGLNLRRGRTQSCGCLQKEITSLRRKNTAKDLTGMKFGKLTAIRLIRKINYKHFWLFRCDCGKEKILDKGTVVPSSAQTKSCGCLKEKILKEKWLGKKNINYCHGMSKTNFYGVWNTMIQRCHNPNASNFKKYGAKNIKVCNRWRKFTNFMQDMYEEYIEHIENFGRKETQIDRLNNKKGYFLNNCHWVTLAEQAKNK
jgi:hypothetical protein